MEQIMNIQTENTNNTHAALIRLRAIVELLAAQIERLTVTPDDPTTYSSVLADVVRQTAPCAPRAEPIRARRSFDAPSFLPVTSDTPAVHDGYFMTDKYLSAAAATENAIIYCAGCDGMYALSKILKIQIYKWGTSENLDPKVRMASLVNNKYASMCRVGTDMISHEGFTNWHPQKLALLDRPVNSPVSLNSDLRFLRVKLPVGLTYRNFEDNFRKQLVEQSLFNFIESDIGVQRCRAFALASRDVFYRATKNDEQPCGYTECHELYRLSPRHHANYVAEVAERLIAQFVETEVK